MTKYCNVCLCCRTFVETFVSYLSLLGVYRYSEFIVNLPAIKIYLWAYNTLVRFFGFRIPIKAPTNQPIMQLVLHPTNHKHTNTRPWRPRVNFDRIARIRSQKYHDVENRSIAKISLTEFGKTWQFLYGKSEVFW